MNLDFNTEITQNVEEYEELYNKLFKKTISMLHIKHECMMSVTFVTKDVIHQINRDYRNIDRPTDVISFAFLDDENEKNIKSEFPLDLGEIYICYEVADENRVSYGNSLKRELCFLFVHGLLHLLGYDHMTKEDEEVMFPLQEEILKGEL